jgi:hypothetical protein
VQRDTVTLLLLLAFELPRRSVLLPGHVHESGHIAAHMQRLLVRR